MDPAAPSVEGPHALGPANSGVWLLAFGHGPRSESWAEKISLCCDRRGIEFELVPVDEVNEATLSLFGVLVLVLPVGANAPLGQFIKLIEAYRVRYPVGLRGLLGSDRVLNEIGAVLVYDDADFYPRPEIVSMRRAVCSYEPVYGAADLDPFGTGDTSAPAPVLPADTPAADSETTRRIVTSWGVQWFPGQVRSVRTLIDDHRRLFDRRKFHDLRRPLPDCDDNRFVFVLERPEFKPAPTVCAATKWTEGGQRAVNRVLEELRSEFPNIRRPPEREGKRGLQIEFHEFYKALCVAGQILRIQE